MPPRLPSVVTIKNIAARARLSLATVSYALRNHPKIATATRQRVQRIAQGLGYRPNPRVASLMAHIRGAHNRLAGERIAFVWVHTSQKSARSDPFLRAVFNGASRRALQSGFALEEYWTNAPGMTDSRLQEIIRARGIVGVVLSPVTTSETAITLNWDWSLFATAVIGNVTWNPELHHAGHHHFLGMRASLLELARRGVRAPAALLEQESNARAKRTWESAFLTHHPRAAPQPFLRCIGEAHEDLDLSALIKLRPDALIVSSLRLLEIPEVQRLRQRISGPVVTLYWEEVSPELAGIDQCYDKIAEAAVDLVIAQLNSNEIGAPDLPRILLFPGRWTDPR